MAHTDADDAPLELSELRNRLDADTYAWLEKHEVSNDCMKEDEAPLFFEAQDDDDEEVRVLQWSSSKKNSNGFGGYDGYINENETKPDEAVTVKYILSASPGGHGDDIWAASRHLSNLLADPVKCSALIQTPHSSGNHPLLGKRLLELGAGGGIPSMTAFKCGASVVCTDQAIPDRIRCLAEAAERNYRDVGHVSNIRVYPYSWGDDFLLEDGETFDVIVAADCVYNPLVHDVLLESIHMLMANDGMALLPFALHGNTDDENVWGIVETAESLGFVVEQLESAQLSPQIKTMDSKRGLVHMLRLSRNKR